MNKSTGLPETNVNYQTIANAANNPLKHSFATSIQFLVNTPSINASPARKSNIHRSNGKVSVVGGATLSYRHSASARQSAIESQFGQDHQNSARKDNVFVDRRALQGDQLLLKNASMRSGHISPSNLGFALSPLARRG